jgi:hypothetical protein
VSSSLNTRTFLARYSLTKDALSSSTETELSAITTGTSQPGAKEPSNPTRTRVTMTDQLTQRFNYCLWLPPFLALKFSNSHPDFLTIGSKINYTFWGALEIEFRLGGAFLFIAVGRSKIRIHPETVWGRETA